MNEKLIPFKIKHIDSLGQGVTHHNDQVSFIAKTLPGETGEARVFKKAKKVQFASISKLDHISKDRITPDCPHFSSCTGCSFLHTDYQTEIDLKYKAALHQFSRLINSEPQVHPAPERFHYRNRIQLHYDKKLKILGLINNTNHEIIEVPRCMIPSHTIQTKLKELYFDNHWLNLVKGHNTKGHLEIQDSKLGTQVYINQAYASGGFSQVNDSMNQQLKKQISELMKDDSPCTIVDLFGGNGNLSSHWKDQRSWIVDFYQTKPQDTANNIYINQNLYHSGALKNLKNQLPQSLDLLILDPPRSGLKNLDEFCQQFNFKNLIYVSCFYPNMIRDLSKIKEQFHLKSLQFFDFFPGTHHLETLAFLERK